MFRKQIFLVILLLMPCVSFSAPASDNEKSYSLTVNATPSDARIRIMNISPKYKEGINLSPGKYDVLVDKQGYLSKREWVEIRDSDLVIDISLKKGVEKKRQAGSYLIRAVKKEIRSDPGLEDGAYLLDEIKFKENNGYISFEYDCLKFAQQRTRMTYQVFRINKMCENWLKKAAKTAHNVKGVKRVTVK